MANVTVRDVFTRLRLLLVAFRNASGTALGTDISDGAAIAAYPAYMVEAGEATRQGTKDRRLVARAYTITVYVEEIPRIEDDAAVEAAKTRCYDWIDDLADYLSEHPRLETDTLPSLGGLVGIGEVSDSGAAVFPPKKGKPHAAFSVQVPVITARS